MMSYQEYAEDIIDAISEGGDIEVFDLETFKDSGTRAKMSLKETSEFQTVNYAWKVSFEGADVYLCESFYKQEIISEIAVFKDKRWTYLLASEGHYSNGDELYRVCRHHEKFQERP